MTESFGERIVRIRKSSGLTQQQAAELYLGWYTFAKADHTDIRALFEDLSAKMTSICGESEEEEETYYSTLTWLDDDGNQARLLINSDENYVTLGYMAAGADERLDEMAAAVERQEIAQEEEIRKANSDNTAGL